MKKLEAIGLFIILEIICNINVFLVNMIAGLFIETNKLIYAIAGIGDSITLFLTWIFLSKNNRKLIFKETFKKISFKKVIYIILIGLGMSIFVSQLTLILVHIFPSYIEIRKQATRAVSSIPQLISIIIIAPIYEEIVFRDIIFGHIKNDKNIGISIALQATLFGLSHDNIVQFIYAFLFGIVLALIYLYCDSIIGSIVAHSVYNFCAAFIAPYLNISKNISYVILIGGIICLVFEFFKFISNYKKQHKTSVENEIY